MKRNIKAWVWGLFGIIIVIVIISERSKINRRKDKAVVTEGVIYNMDSRAKGEKYIAYSFVVQDKKYYGTTSINFCNDCKNDCCQIGVKVKVRYEKGDPDNNDLIH